MRWARGRRVLYAFLMTASSAVVGVIVGLITISDRIPVQLATIGLYIVLVLGLGGSLVVIGLASLEDLREQIGRRAFMDAVPTVVVFKRQHVAITVGEQGEAELEWTLDVELDPVNPPRELRIPLWKEIPSESAAGRGVSVLSIKVEGREHLRPGQNPYELIEVRRRFGSGLWSEFGVLRIPLIYGMTRQLVQARVNLATAFPRVADRGGDAWTLEIGHLTEMVEVTVRPRIGYGQVITMPPPVEEAIRCGSAISVGGIDYEETLLRSQEYREVEEDGGTHLEWKGWRPKLGYLYRVRFQILPTDRPEGQRSGQQETRRGRGL